MVKQPKRKETTQRGSSTTASAPRNQPPSAIAQLILSRFWMPLFLAAVAFFTYWPSLQSDFVYDARKEILEEGFLTSLTNLPAVLSLKVLSMHLFLGDRPGQLLYLMLIAAVCGKAPFGYHLCSNLLHAANVALLFVLLRRLIVTEASSLSASDQLKVHLGAIAVTLIFAIHPLAVESVAEVSYSSSLLVTLFTLLALLIATAFRPEKLRSAILLGGLGTLCAFTSVTCKESGITASLMMIVYWFLFRRKEAKKPWLLFLGTASAVIVVFLVLRFAWAAPSEDHFTYLGGSFLSVFWIQPRLWVFMMGKVLCPVHLSADYTLENLNGLTTPVALALLLVVVMLQGWLALRSRIGALGVATYWLGLITVSNFIPLYRILADRFYYLPLAGMAMQVMAVLLILLQFRQAYWIAVMPCFIAIVPLALLAVNRQQVFANNLNLWSDTVLVSPFSSIAHNNLGDAFLDKSQIDDAMAQYQAALALDPLSADIQSNIGQIFLKKGQYDQAIAQYQKALGSKPNSAIIQANLAGALLQKGSVDAAIAEFRKSLDLNPINGSAHNNLGLALFQKGEVNEAIAEYQKALAMDPGLADAYHNLGLAFLRQGQTDDAIAEFQKSLELNSSNAAAHDNLGNALLKKGRTDEAIAQYQEALAIDPNNSHAHNNLGLVLLQKGEVNEAINQLQEVVRLKPKDENALKTLANAQVIARQFQGSR